MAEKDALIEMLMKQIDLLQKQLELSARNEASKDKLIAEQAQTISDLRAVIEELRELKAGLEETVREFQRKLFGISSERTSSSKKEVIDPTDDDTPDCSDTVEVLDGETYKVIESKKPRQPKRSRNDLYKDLPIHRIDIPATGEACTCPYCNGQMQHLTYKFAREELRIIPAKVKRVHLYKELLSCPKCAGDGDTTITEGSVPNGLLPHSPLSASLAAEVIYRKVADFLPFFRMEKDTAQLGAVIPRETSSGWFIKCAEKYFLPIYNALHDEQLKREVLHADELCKD